MTLDEISQILASAAGLLKEPAQGVISRALVDAYQTAKKKLVADSKESEGVEPALNALEAKPGSNGRRLTLTEELEDAGVEASDELLILVRELKKMVSEMSGVAKNTKISIKQSGSGNSIKVAGRDLIETNKIIRKNVIVTDERHIDGKQALTIRNLVEKVADRLADEEGKPNFRAAYGKLQRKMAVTSYKQILKEDFEDAVSYLRQLNAQNLPKLKKSAPTKYSNSLFAAIYAKWRDLGHEKEDIYGFTEERLGLKRKISSLKDLGPNKLKWLNEALDSKIAKRRRLTT